MILIVEDDVLILEHLSSILSNEGYTKSILASSYKEALSALNNNEISLTLLDINLGDEKSGFDFSHELNSRKIPFIFISAQSDPMAQEQIVNSKPYGFILKPFKPIEVSTSVKLAMQSVEQKTIRIDDGKSQHIVHFDDILFIQSNRNYVEIINGAQRLVVRKTLQEIEQLLPASQFCRSHRSFIVNKSHINTIHQKDLLVNGHRIPVSQKYKSNFIEI